MLFIVVGIIGAVVVVALGVLMNNFDKRARSASSEQTQQDTSDKNPSPKKSKKR